MKQVKGADSTLSAVRCVQHEMLYLFLLDIELHRKKTPLEVRMSEKYISEKQR